MPQDIVELVKKHLSAFNSKDWDRYKGTLSEDAAYEEEPTHRKVEGPEQILTLLQQWAKAFPDLKGTVKEIFASGNKAVAEILWEGTHKGELSGPMGTIPPTGKFGKVSAVEVFTFEGDRVSEMRHYFDLMSLLAQLGLAPEAGARPPAV